jgi:hypothetical protein
MHNSKHRQHTDEMKISDILSYSCDSRRGGRQHGALDQTTEDMTE